MVNTHAYTIRFLINTGVQDLRTYSDQLPSHMTVLPVHKKNSRDYSEHSLDMVVIAKDTFKSSSLHLQMFDWG